MLDTRKVSILSRSRLTVGNETGDATDVTGSALPVDVDSARTLLERVGALRNVRLGSLAAEASTVVRATRPKLHAPRARAGYLRSLDEDWTICLWSTSRTLSS